MKRTTDSVIKDMRKMVEERQTVSPAWWVEAAQSLNLLVEKEEQEMYALEHNLATTKANHLSDPDMTSAKANALIEASEEYLQYKLLKAKVKRVDEFIRIAKKQATLTDDKLTRI